MSVRTKPRYAKFAKMLKMHLPMGAVCAKMAGSGFSTAEVDAFKNDRAVDPKAAAAAPAGKRRPMMGGLLAGIKKAKKAKEAAGPAPGSIMAQILAAKSKMKKKRGSK